MGTMRVVDEVERPFRRPSGRLFLTEWISASRELAALGAALPQLCTGPRGDGHAVLVLPGFLADDSSTVALRGVLTARGLRAEPSKLGRNLGPTQAVIDGYERRLASLHRATGRRVSVIGQSLGGLYARDLARRFPGLVRGVITLGSPIQLVTADSPDLTWAGRTYEALRPWHAARFDRAARESELPPLQVPSTAVYSRADGVVPWSSCLAPAGPTSENVEVTSSHCGMGVDPAVVALVLDRLLQEEGRWRPYRAPAKRSCRRAA